MNDSAEFVDFGMHKGQRWTRMPVSYLRWMINSGHTKKEHAEKELERRGTTMPTLEISGHAIDRASQHLLEIWEATRRDANEGLHAWLMRRADEAIKTQGTDKDGACELRGLRFVFEDGGIWPVLKTVMRKQGRDL